ncbi:hypothetical protein GCM10029992_04120 [Glycomyces albus]
MHLESWRHMTTEDRLMNPHIQSLVNDGTVDQVLPTDDVECDLLVLRYPRSSSSAPANAAASARGA